MPCKLACYPLALDALAAVDEVALRLPRIRWYLADQLMRAAASVVLNLREGGGEYAPAEKTRFYRLAYRSIAECEGGLDIVERLQLLPAGELRRARQLLSRLGILVHQLIRRRTPRSSRPRAAGQSTRARTERSYRRQGDGAIGQDSAPRLPRDAGARPRER